MNVNYPLYTHDDLIVLTHANSGMIAQAPRDLVACARDDEMRTAFTTQFVRYGVVYHNDFVRFPNGWQICAPSPEEQRWRAAVVKLLDAYAGISLEDRRWTDLQVAWREGKDPVVEPHESDLEFYARLHRRGGNL